MPVPEPSPCGGKKGTLASAPAERLQLLLNFAGRQEVIGVKPLYVISPA